MRVNLKGQTLLYSAAGALFLAGTLQAGLVSIVSGTGHFYDLSQTPFGCSDAGTTTASCDFMTSLDAYHFASGSYQANAQYGSLDVTSMSSVYDLSIGDMAGAATASFADTFLLTGGIGSGTLVFVTEYRGFGQGESCDTGACLTNSTVTLNAFTAHPISNGPTITDLSFSFTFGTLFDLNGSASAYSSALGDETATQTAHLKIDSIEVLNSDGTLNTNFGVTTGSGANYPFVTPESGTFVLVIGGVLISLAVLRHRYIGAHRVG